MWKPGDTVSTPCIEWTGRTNRQGYGRAVVNNRFISAHRLAASMKYGPEAIVGKCVIHACDNKACWNPEHLFLGTNQDNMMDLTLKRTRSYAPSLATERS